ncbi:hypothetical protein CI102_14804 [Trichoderma harzianum]|nr:hypothetical protein CI102_14804 [Trichoderma harzianum]
MNDVVAKMYDAIAKCDTASEKNKEAATMLLEAAKMMLEAADMFKAAAEQFKAGVEKITAIEAAGTTRVSLRQKEDMRNALQNNAWDKAAEARDRERAGKPPKTQSCLVQRVSL